METTVAYAPKILSGIDVIDQSWGGMYRGGSYLVYGRAASGRDLLTLKFVQTGVLYDESSLFISPGRPKDLMIQAASINFHLREAYESGLVKLMRIPPMLNLAQVDDEGVTKALSDLVHIIRRHRPNRLVINDFMPFVQFRSFDRFRMAFVDMLEQVDPLDMTMLLVMAEPANQQSRKVIEFMTNQMTGAINIAFDEADAESTKRRLTLIPNIGHIRHRLVDYWDLAEIVETEEGSVATSLRMLEDAATEVSKPTPAPEARFEPPAPSTPDAFRSFPTTPADEAPEPPARQAPAAGQPPAPSVPSFQKPLSDEPAYDEPAYDAPAQEAPATEPHDFGGAAGAEEPSEPAYEEPAQEARPFPTFTSPFAPLTSEPPVQDTPAEPGAFQTSEPAEAGEPSSFVAPAYDPLASEAPTHDEPSFDTPQSFDTPAYEETPAEPASFEAPAAPSTEPEVPSEPSADAEAIGSGWPAEHPEPTVDYSATSYSDIVSLSAKEETEEETHEEETHEEETPSLSSPMSDDVIWDEIDGLAADDADDDFSLQELERDLEAIAQQKMRPDFGLSETSHTPAADDVEAAEDIEEDTPEEVAPADTAEPSFEPPASVFEPTDLSSVFSAEDEAATFEAPEVEPFETSAPAESRAWDLPTPADLSEQGTDIAGLEASEDVPDQAQQAEAESFRLGSPSEPAHALPAEEDELDFFELEWPTGEAAAQEEIVEQHSAEEHSAEEHSAEEHPTEEPPAVAPIPLGRPETSTEPQPPAPEPPAAPVLPATDDYYAEAQQHFAETQPEEETTSQTPADAAPEAPAFLSLSDLDTSAEAETEEEELLPYTNREAFRTHLQQHFVLRDTQNVPFLLVALRMEAQTDAATRLFEFAFILELVSDALRDQDDMLVDARDERLVILLTNSRSDEAQRFFGRLKERLRVENPEQADTLLHSVAAIVVPDGRPFQNADEFLAYALDEG